MCSIAMYANPGKALPIRNASTIPKIVGQNNGFCVGVTDSHTLVRPPKFG